MRIVVEAMLRVVAGCVMVMESHTVHVLVHLVVEGSSVLEVQSRLHFGLDVPEGVVEGERVLWVAALLVHEVLVVLMVVVHASCRGHDLVALLGQLAVLGTAVLEPDLDLTLGQVQGVRELRLPANGDVPGRVVLLLQLHALKVRVDHAVLVLSPCLACEKRRGEGEVGLVFSLEESIFHTRTETARLEIKQSETVPANDAPGTISRPPPVITILLLTNDYVLDGVSVQLILPRE